MKKRILVVEDDASVREMVKKMLERVGYDVIEAQNGSEAIERFQKAPTDLIITDIIMPDKEGIETIMELRRDFPDVKIIAISGGGRVGPDWYLTAARKLGAAKTFCKPFDRQEMLDAVHELVRS